MREVILRYGLYIVDVLVVTLLFYWLFLLVKRIRRMKVHKIMIPTIIGLVLGAATGEFAPGVFATGLVGQLGAVFSQPFSPYRNEVAVKYAFFGAIIGLVIGFIWHQVSKETKE